MLLEQNVGTTGAGVDPPAYLHRRFRPRHRISTRAWTRVRCVPVAKIFSNLNLNGRTPPRVQPQIGEWGPDKVPTTKQKKRMRIYVLIALPVTMLACFLVGWYAYYLTTGCYGFGMGCRSK